MCNNLNESYTEKTMTCVSPCGYILFADFKATTTTATTDKPIGQYFEEKTQRRKGPSLSQSL